jgi:hypothetical protein
VLAGLFGLHLAEQGCAPFALFVTTEPVRSAQLKWQGSSVTDEKAMVRYRGPHSRITVLPGDIHAQRRQAFFHLHSRNQAPLIRAFIGGKIGSRLVPSNPVEIRGSALKDMNGPDHRALQFNLPR